jgi:hypothetical protein
MNKHEFDERLPGESFEEYLKRHKAHPSQPDRRAATEEEEMESDVTQEHLERGYVIERRGHSATVALPEHDRGGRVVGVPASSP